MRHLLICMGVGSFLCGLGLYGCEDDPAPSAVTGGTLGTGGSATGGTLGTGGSATGGTLGTGGSATGGTLGTGGDMADAGYTPPTPTLPVAVGYIAGGNFEALGTYTGISGHGQIIRLADGKTTVQLHVEGLTAATDYAAHVHALPCSVDNAGGHYMIDPALDPGETNEIWTPFTTDADGVGRASVDVNHAARPDAQAIVIHDPAANNAKMACVDLLPEPLATTTASGTFAPFAGATADEMDVAGTATMIRSASGTEVTLALTGLDSTATYMAHVHAFPCAITDAGGHYKIDPTITDAMEANELWPAFGSTAGSATITSTHVARPDAQSVVVHRTDLGITPAPKVACADLVREEAYGNYVTEGSAVELAGATTKGVAGLSGSATLSRSVAPSTEATITVTGLLASTAYGIHVHDHSCGLNDGGGHYKIDPTIATAEQTNEMWLNLTTDNTGGGTQTVSVTHIARPEAGAIVVHDPDGTRVACIDLL